MCLLSLNKVRMVAHDSPVSCQSNNHRDRSNLLLLSAEASIKKQQNEGVQCLIWRFSLIIHKNDSSDVVEQCLSVIRDCESKEKVHISLFSPSGWTPLLSHCKMSISTRPLSHFNFFRFIYNSVKFVIAQLVFTLGK